MDGSHDHTGGTGPLELHPGRGIQTLARVKDRGRPSQLSIKADGRVQGPSRSRLVFTHAQTCLRVPITTLLRSQRECVPKALSAGYLEMLRDGRRIISRSAEDSTDISFGLRFLERSQESRCSRRQFRPLRFHHCHVGNRAQNLLVPGAAPTTITSNQAVTHIDRLLFSLRHPRFHPWRCGTTRRFLNQATFTMGQRQTRIAGPRAEASPPLVGFFPTQFSCLVRSGLFSYRSMLTTSGAAIKGGAITPATTLKVSPNTQSGLSFCFWGLLQLGHVVGNTPKTHATLRTAAITGG